MKRLRGLIARADGSTVTGVVSFGETIESVEAGGGADATDYIVPGFIDLQVNGRGGIDVMNATAGALRELSAELAREGTTAWLPTAITSPLARIEAVAAKIAEATAEAIAEAAGAHGVTSAILGMHLEGPFISAARLGAHPAHNLEPRGAALERVAALPALRMITLAPELNGALEAMADADARAELRCRWAIPTRRWSRRRRRSPRARGCSRIRSTRWRRLIIGIPERRRPRCCPRARGPR